MLLEVLLDIGHRINLSCAKSDTALKETTNAFCFFFFFAVMPSLMCSFCHTRHVSCVKVWLHASTVKCNAGNHLVSVPLLGFFFSFCLWLHIGLLLVEILMQVLSPQFLLIHTLYYSQSN